MTKYVLVVAGDQLAKDVVTLGEPARDLASASNKSIVLIDVSDPKKIRHSENYGEEKTAQILVRNLESYQTKINKKLAELDDWEPAGVWWCLGLDDCAQVAYAENGQSGKLAAFQQNLETLLAWNPFGDKSTKSYVSLMPHWNEELWSLADGNIDAINEKISAAVEARGESVVLISDPAEFPVSYTRTMEHNKTDGLSESGAIALAKAFAAKNAEDFGGGEGGEGAHIVPVTVTVTTYEAHDRTITRNRLAGLEGKTVMALIDGVAYSGLVVSDEGELVLPVAGNIVTVGLPYNSVLAPMPIDTDNNEGSTLGKRRAFGRCVARVYRSYGGKYAASRPTNLYDVNAWTSLDFYAIPILNDDENVKLYSGDVEFVLPAGQDPDTTIWVVHNLPYPFRLVSLMAEVDFGEQ